MKKTVLMTLSLCIVPFIALADIDNTPNALRDFSDFDTIIPRNNNTNDNDDSIIPQYSSSRSYKEEIIPYIKSAISETSANIISDPEQAFCYQVEKRNKNDKRYTLDGFAIKNFCGELDKGAISTAYSALFTKSPNILTQASQCRIEPKIMIRFVRGVDYADVLLSSPCPSFTIFYAGKYKAFNIKQGIIDDIIKQLSEKTEIFHSPALIRQTVANAEANSAEESEALEKKQREHAAQAELYNEEKQEQDEEPTPKSGWGNINLKFKK